MSKSRRWLSLILVSCSLAVACSKKSEQSASSTPPPPSNELAVLEWAGYDAKDFWIDFANKNPAVKVSFEIGSSDADVYGKMKGGAKSDIFHAYTGWLQFYVDEGLVEEIDVSKLSNWSKVPENFRKIGQINGKQYFVPWDWGFTSILYRTDKVKGKIDSWAALLDPEVQGTHFDLGRRAGHGDRLLVHPWLRRNEYHAPSSWRRSRRSGSSSVR